MFAPGFGWVDFDPTNGIMPSDSHITLAWGRDYNDVGPAKGILIGGKRHWLEVGVDVVPVEAGLDPNFLETLSSHSRLLAARVLRAPASR